VIRVLEGGAIESSFSGVYAPEFTVGTDADGQVLAEHEAQMIADVKAQGWELVSGWTGQYGYSGPIMHPSEFIGGALEQHIRETPGYWVAVAVEGDDYEPAAGWALAYRETL
jgi:hypothetical protein